MKLYRSLNLRWTTLLLHRYTHTYTHVKHMQNAIISHVNGCFCVCPAQTYRCPLSSCACNKRGGTQTCQNNQVKSTESSSAHTSSRYLIVTHTHSSMLTQRWLTVKTKKFIFKLFKKSSILYFWALSHLLSALLYLHPLIFHKPLANLLLQNYYILTLFHLEICSSLCRPYKIRAQRLPTQWFQTII